MIASISFALMLAQVKTTDLKDGFVRVETSKYTIEVPKGWEVGAETSFGQREIVSNTGALTTMTGGASKLTWQQLYDTSLYFIRRTTKDEPTPFRIGKNKKGYETMSFEMVGKDKQPSSKYVILKNAKSEILALSVKIKSVKTEKEMNRIFERLISTADIK